MIPFALDDLTYTILGKEYPLPLDRTNGKTKDGILMYATILFAVNGYDGVSMKDIANAVQIKAASLYNHFSSKEAIWTAVVHHIEQLFLVYLETLETALAPCNSLAEIFELVYREPKRLTNSFTTFAFTMLRNESLRNPLAWQVVHDTFYVHALHIIRRQFERFTDDANTLAITILLSVYGCLTFDCQKMLGRTVSFVPTEIASNIEDFLRRSIENNPPKIAE